jgi:hypothetical protein
MTKTYAKWKTALKAYPQDKIASDGYAAFTSRYVQANGALPKFVALGRLDKPKTAKVFRTKTTTIYGPHDDIALTGVAFDALKPERRENAGVEVQFRRANVFTRARYRPLDTFVAVAALIGAIATAIAALVGGIVKPGVPLWFLCVVCIVVAIAASSRFLQDLRKNDDT